MPEMPFVWLNKSARIGGMGKMRHQPWRFGLALAILACCVGRGLAQPVPGSNDRGTARSATLGFSPVPGVEERRVVKGADGQWYFVDEIEAGQEKPPVEKKDDVVKSIREEISKMLTVNIKGKGKLQLYGLARGDAYFATSRFFPSLEIPFFALSEDAKAKAGPLGATFLPTVPGAVPIKEDDSSFTMNARLSRIGVVYTGEKAKWLGDAEIEGRVELDFYNTLDNVIASRAMPRIRHGYAKATWGGFSILLGQYWDIISPLYPTINDDLLMWNAGNLGDRRPQLRLNWDVDLGCDRTFILTLGATATDTVNRTDFGGDGFFDGEETGVPGFQGRVAWKFPARVCDKKSEIGFWGLFSADATNVPIGLSGRSHFTSYAYGADWQIPLRDWLEFRGEAWYGSNLDDYRGGINQGVNTVLGREIRAWGGWAEFVVKPVEWYQLAVGGTIDNPRDNDVKGTALPRNYNWTYYFGNRFPVGGGLTFAIDLEFWRTGYLGAEEGTAERIKFWLMQVF